VKLNKKALEFGRIGLNLLNQNAEADLIHKKIDGEETVWYFREENKLVDI